MIALKLEDFDYDNILLSLAKLARALKLNLTLQVDHTLDQMHSRWAFYNQIANALISQEKNVLVLDEAQRDIYLIEFLVKTNCKYQNLHLIIAGTPPHGSDTVDYGGSARARCNQMLIPCLDCYEVYTLLKVAFGTNVSTQTWLDLWALFGGDPSLYQQFYGYLQAKSPETIAKMAQDGIDSETISWCYQRVVSQQTQTGIEPMVANAIGGGLVRDIVPNAIARDVAQLINRKILNCVATMSAFVETGEFAKPTDLLWNDFLTSMSQTQPALDVRCNFNNRRGFALENMLQVLVDLHLLDNTLTTIIDPGPNIIGRLRSFTLSYEGNTDADLLLIELQTSQPDLLIDGKLTAIVFNVKTNPSRLLGKKDGLTSQKQFTLLCNEFAKRYNVRLCLAVKSVDQDTSTQILHEWKPFPFPVIEKVLSLDDFQQVAVTKNIAFSHEKDIIVQRPRLETKILELVQGPGLLPNILIQGRYRVGKTQLLQDMCASNSGWAYCEIAEK